MKDPLKPKDRKVVVVVIAILLGILFISCDTQLEIDNQEQVSIYQDNPEEYLYSDLSNSANANQLHENGTLYKFWIDDNSARLQVPDYVKSVKIPGSETLEINGKNVVRYKFNDAGNVTFRMEY